MTRQRDPAASLTLHVLRIKGMAEAEALAASAGLAVDVTSGHLADLASYGLAEHRDGALPGWRPTGRGVQHDVAWLAEELDAAGIRRALQETYRSFLVLNPELLKVCTAWQLVDANDGSLVPNDHRDASYDAGVVARLAELQHRVQPVVLEMAHHLPRFDPYGLRLQRALDRVQGGDGDWFTRPLLDSYHQVWFELHQDMLLTLGLERTTDDAPGDKQRSAR